MSESASSETSEAVTSSSTSQVHVKPPSVRVGGVKNGSVTI